MRSEIREGTVLETQHEDKPVSEAGTEFGMVHEPGSTEASDHIRRQTLLAELGMLALRRKPLHEILHAAARTAAEGLGAPFAIITRRLPDNAGFQVLAGYGWKQDVAGSVITASAATSTGHAVFTGDSVICNQVQYDSPFRLLGAPASHGVRRAINVTLHGETEPFGALEVFSPEPGEFQVKDLAFLQGIANLLALAIEQRHTEERLKGAIAHQKALLKEANHRVKNSLQLVASMLRLQAASVDEATKRHLSDAQARVMAIARAHERLYKTERIVDLDLSSYLKEVCADLDGGSVICNGPEGIRIATDRAIPLALLVSELVTNCLKYAYPDGQPAPVYVNVDLLPNENVRVRVSDQGVGLPPDFDPERATTLGMRLIKSFAHRLSADVSFQHRNPGTEVTVVMPREEPKTSLA